MFKKCNFEHLTKDTCFLFNYYDNKNSDHFGNLLYIDEMFSDNKKLKTVFLPAFYQYFIKREVKNEYKLINSEDNQELCNNYQYYFANDPSTYTTKKYYEHCDSDWMPNL